MKIDIDDFNQKAEHIIETVVKPQVERYERAKAIEKASANFSEGKFILTSPIHKIFYRMYLKIGRSIKVRMEYYQNNEED
jgi:uncharacterized protein YueI